MGNMTKQRGGGSISVDVNVLRMRQQAYFKEKSNVIRSGNEFVIAMRKHAGPFPVYAFYDGGTFKCYTIEANNKMKLTGKTISALGVAT
jgi:hypothetical protein